MLTMLKDWKGTVEINGTQYGNINDITVNMLASDSVCIKLLPQTRNGGVEADKQITGTKEYRITVKKYMTQPTEPGSSFDFMARMNNNNPMPMRTMVGTVIKQTPGMVYMELRGQASDREIHCMRCGRALTNPVSRHYGIGPECLNKMGFVVDPEDVSAVEDALKEITWTGWVIRSSILSQEEV